MKCGFGTFTCSEPAGKKKRGKALLFMQPTGNIILLQGKGTVDQGVYIHRTMVIQKKYKQFFHFIYLIIGALRKLWYSMRKKTCKINGKMKIC